MSVFISSNMVNWTRYQNAQKNVDKETQQKSKEAQTHTHTHKNRNIVRIHFAMLTSPHSVIFHFLELCPEHTRIQMKNEWKNHHSQSEKYSKLETEK